MLCIMQNDFSAWLRELSMIIFELYVIKKNSRIFLKLKITEVINWFIKILKKFAD